VITQWQGQAFNQTPDSDNEIHGDDLAKQYGFKGGLVPGVTISAYLCHPAAEAWGLEWLTRGSARVRVSSPLYDEEAFTVAITAQNGSSYTAQLLRPEGTVSATAEVCLPDAPAKPPTRRGDSIADPDYQGPPASVESWSQLQQQGCRALRYHWREDNPMRSYLRDETRMPALLIDSSSGGFANMSFILGCSNWVLASNAYMNPWVHLETYSQNFKAIPTGTNLVAEMTVTDFYEKKGHEFVDADIALFDEADDACLSTIQLRAIYKLRGDQ
jgi:hypothetical protein